MDGKPKPSTTPEPVEEVVEEKAKEWNWPEPKHDPIQYDDHMLEQILN